VDLLASPEQEEIAATVAAFCAEHLSIRQLRSRIGEAAAVDPATWARLAELGWFGLGLGADQGGAGYSVVEEAFMFRELGRCLAPGPVLGAVLGARVAAACGDATRCRSILAGEALVAFGDPDAGAVVGPRLDGRLLLLDAPGSDYVVVCDTSGAALLAIGEVGPLQRLDSLDPGVRLATAEVSDLAPLHFVDAATEPVGLRAQVLVAAEAAGIAEATRDISVAYALARQQFGKPIGAHQAVKHRCADMAVAAVAASAQAFFAALALDRSSPDAAFQCASATFVATTAAMGNATRNISNHGGLGFTWEHDAHLYLKRAHLLEALLGGRAAHLCELLDAPGPLTV
jgi:alkylation response protein AidB-like acyl-CoA dehydrogenase